ADLQTPRGDRESDLLVVSRRSAAAPWTLALVLPVDPSLAAHLAPLAPARVASLPRRADASGAQGLEAYTAALQHWLEARVPVSQRTTSALVVPNIAILRGVVEQDHVDRFRTTWHYTYASRPSDGRWSAALANGLTLTCGTLALDSRRTPPAHDLFEGT